MNYATAAGTGESEITGEVRAHHVAVQHLNLSAGARLCVRLDPMAAPLAPTGSATGDAVEALACAARAASLRLGHPGEPWAMVNSLTAGRLLAASLART